jgi:glycosyltransferase involved in cell wall biosynthesis
MLQKSKFEIKLLSVVVPAYKQEETIYKDIQQIIRALEEHSFNYELIIVVDGLLDKTYQILSKLKSPNIKIIAYKKNQGKGYAVRYGMNHARGDIVGFIDSGMDIHPAGLKMLLNHMEWYDADIIVGSKLHPVSRVEHYPLQRKILSSGYRIITRMLFGFKIRDTQVGIKFFKKKVASEVFSRSLINSFAFDVEVLALARALGYKKIYEAPILLNFNKGSSISPLTSPKLWRILARMLLDTIIIFIKLKNNNYLKTHPGKQKK